MADQVITTDEFKEVMGALKSISKGHYTERLALKLKSKQAKDLQSAINAAMEALDSYLGEDREAAMALALGLSECFAVMAQVRSGDLSARVSDEMLQSEHELMSQFGAALNETFADIGRQIDTIRRQQDNQMAMEHLVRQLQTPILELWDDVLCLPVIGMVDSRRSAEMMETLLNEIVSHRSKYVILDITGVEIVDTRTADHFVKVMKSAELLGTRCVMTGIRPAVAQTLVELGVDLSSIHTLRNLQEGLRFCLREAGSRGNAMLGGEG
jgi:anti-anti-sigma regulatory factor